MTGYVTCPQCGSHTLPRFEGNETAVACQACGWVQVRNPPVEKEAEK